MKQVPMGLCAAAVLSLFILFTTTAPAAAISADLATKCRQMAIKEYPPKPVGTKGGTAEAQRKYYRDCIANKGSTPESNTQNSRSAPSR